MLKKIGIAIVVLIAIVAGVSWYLFSNLDSIVRAAIEKYASAATQTPVSVGSVKISLTTGEGSIAGLTIANPNGFSTSQAVSIGAMSVKLDPSSVTGSGPIVIKEIAIDAPQVTYETNGSTSNLQTLEKNAQAYAGKLNSGGASSGPGRKEIIDDLYVRDGQVAAAAAQLPGKMLTVPLPAIHLTDIGKGSGGATPAQIAGEVVSAISREASQAGAKALEQQLQNTVTNTVQGGAAGAAGVTNQIKGLFGK